jgi:hypothetical protein
MAGKRKSPKARSTDMPAMPRMNSHQKMMSEMHSALYDLDNKISPIRNPKATTDLLPKELQPSEKDDMKILAQKHVKELHKAFKQTARKQKDASKSN